MNIFLRLINKNKILAPKKAFSIADSTVGSLKKVTIKIDGDESFLQIGENCRVQNCEIRIKGKNNRIIIDDNVVFKSGKIYLIGGENQEINIGKNTTVEGAYLLTDENASIYIADDCMLATDIIIRTGDKHSIIDKSSGRRLNYSEDIVIGKHVWLGRSVHVLKGSTLPANTIVGARSLVNKKFIEENTVIAGSPAKVVKHDINWLRELID